MQRLSLLNAGCGEYSADFKRAVPRIVNGLELPRNLIECCQILGATCQNFPRESLVESQVVAERINRVSVDLRAG
jgi:hypothetical protein